MGQIPGGCGGSGTYARAGARSPERATYNCGDLTAPNVASAPQPIQFRSSHQGSAAPTPQPPPPGPAWSNTQQQRQPQQPPTVVAPGQGRSASPFRTPVRSSSPFRSPSQQRATNSYTAAPLQPPYQAGSSRWSIGSAGSQSPMPPTYGSAVAAPLRPGLPHSVSPGRERRLSRDRVASPMELRQSRSTMALPPRAPSPLPTGAQATITPTACSQQMLTSAESGRPPRSPSPVPGMQRSSAARAQVLTPNGSGYALPAGPATSIPTRQFASAQQGAVIRVASQERSGTPLGRTSRPMTPHRAEDGIAVTAARAASPGPLPQMWQYGESAHQSLRPPISLGPG